MNEPELTNKTKASPGGLAFFFLAGSFSLATGWRIDQFVRPLIGLVLVGPTMVPATHVEHHGSSGSSLALTEFGAVKARSFKRSPAGGAFLGFEGGKSERAAMGLELLKTGPRKPMGA